MTYPVSTMIQKTVSIGNLNSGRDGMNISQASTQKSNYYSDKNNGPARLQLSYSNSVGKTATNSGSGRQRNNHLGHQH